MLNSEIIHEVLGYLVVKMYAVFTYHVVFLSWVDKKVGVDVCIDAGTYERHGVLGYACVVVAAA